MINLVENMDMNFKILDLEVIEQMFYDLLEIKPHDKREFISDDTPLFEIGYGTRYKNGSIVYVSPEEKMRRETPGYEADLRASEEEKEKERKEEEEMQRRREEAEKVREREKERQEEEKQKQQKEEQYKQYP
uniref:Uncharacterized protein n=1 Tax=Lotharella globosa TaxID=91324 RepID=A0A7S3YZE4_9EUKA